MALQFINYYLDDFNDEHQINTENERSIWNSTELHQNQNLNHSRAPNITYQENSLTNFDFVY